MTVSFWYNSREIKWNDQIASEILDGTNEIIINCKNDTPRTVTDLSLETELPLDVDMPEVIPPDSEVDITLTASSKDLLDFRPTERPKLHWKWLEVIR